MTTNEESSVTLSHRLQILATEHWSLLASRSLAWSESFNRATMFLATLSGAVVALALVAQASSFGRMFSIFALIILPVVLFIGVTTFIRLGATNYHDALCVTGMNRIRHAYLEIAPDMAQYFVMSAHDDERGVAITMGLPPAMPFYQHMLAATPTVIVMINSIIAGVIASIAVSLVTDQSTIVALAGVIGFLLSAGLHQLAAKKSIGRAIGGFKPRFPTEGASV
jgi:hypothetical protein